MKALQKALQRKAKVFKFGEFRSESDIRQYFKEQDRDFLVTQPLEELISKIKVDKSKIEEEEDRSSNSSFTDFINHDRKVIDLKEYLESVRLPPMLDYKYNKDKYHSKAVEIIDQIEDESSIER